MLGSPATGCGKKRPFSLCLRADGELHYCTRHRDADTCCCLATVDKAPSLTLTPLLRAPWQVEIGMGRAGCAEELEGTRLTKVVSAAETTAGRVRTYAARVERGDRQAASPDDARQAGSRSISRAGQSRATSIAPFALHAATSSYAIVSLPVSYWSKRSRSNINPRDCVRRNTVSFPDRPSGGA